MWDDKVCVEYLGVLKTFKRKSFPEFSSSGNPASFFQALLYPRIFKKVHVVKAVDNVNLKVYSGEILCLIGPNGSGKTTLLKLTAGLLKPDLGRILINSVDISTLEAYEIARMLTFVPGLLSGGAWIRGDMTARKNLELYAYWYSLPKSKVDEVLETVGLSHVKDSYVATFSSGMYARLVLAAGLMKESKLYLMDEPTLGLSRELVVTLRDFIRKTLCEKQGATVIYATNIVEEAEKLADRIVMLRNGKIATVGSVKELKKRLGEIEIIEVELKDITRKEAFQIAKKINNLGVKAVIDVNVRFKDGGKPYFTVKSRDSRETLPELIHIFSKACKIRYVNVREPSLEDLYLKLYGGMGNED